MEQYKKNLEIIKSFVEPYKLSTDEQMYMHVLKESFRANPRTNHTLTYDFERDNELLSNPYVKAVLDSGSLDFLTFRNGLSIIHICPMVYADIEYFDIERLTDLELLAIFLFFKQGVVSWIDLTHSNCPSFTRTAQKFKRKMNKFVSMLEFEFTLDVQSLNDAIINLCKHIPLDEVIYLNMKDNVLYEYYSKKEMIEKYRSHFNTTNEFKTKEEVLALNN